MEPSVVIVNATESILLNCFTNIPSLVPTVSWQFIDTGPSILVGMLTIVMVSMKSVVLSCSSLCATIVLKCRRCGDEFHPGFGWCLEAI